MNENLLDGVRKVMNIHNMDGQQLDLVTLAERYSGQWVALDPDDGAVVAAGDSAKTVYDAAELDGVKMPVVLRVLNDYGQLALSLA